jgi:hypothetical protein
LTITHRNIASGRARDEAKEKEIDREFKELLNPEGLED